MKNILLALDIGNVCVKINHNNFMKNLGYDDFPESVKKLYKDYECGIINEEASFLRQLSDVFNGKFSPAQLLDAFNSIIMAPVPGMTELAAEFKTIGVNAAFFSDISITHLKRVSEIFPSFHEISKGAVSFESGHWKPDKEMFEYFEQHFGVPDLYVDDREVLIEAALERNWNAYQFIDAEDLRKKLTSLS